MLRGEQRSSARELQRLDIKPGPLKAAALAPETGAFPHHTPAINTTAPARLLVVGLKGDRALKIQGAAGLGGQDLKPQPAHQAAGLLQGPAALGFRLMGRAILRLGAQQVIHIAQGEGAVAGAHQLFGRGGQSLAAQQGATAVGGAEPAAAAAAGTTAGSGSSGGGAKAAHGLGSSPFIPWRREARGRCRAEGLIPSRSASSRPAASL